MLDAIEAIEGYVVDGREAFLTDRRTRDAVIRNLEVIGEAARGFSDDFRARFPEIPWRRVVGLRDKLIHDYPGVEAEVVWAVVERHLPALRKAMERARAHV